MECQSCGYQYGRSESGIASEDRAQRLDPFHKHDFVASMKGEELSNKNIAFDSTRKYGRRSRIVTLNFCPKCSTVQYRDSNIGYNAGAYISQVKEGEESGKGRKLQEQEDREQMNVMENEGGLSRKNNEVGQ